LPHDDRASLRFRLGRCLRNPRRSGRGHSQKIEQIRGGHRVVWRLDKHVFKETPSVQQPCVGLEHHGPGRPPTLHQLGGCYSRPSVSHGGGQWFESTSAHHSTPMNTRIFRQRPGAGLSRENRHETLAGHEGAFSGRLPHRRTRRRHLSRSPTLRHGCRRGWHPSSYTDEVCRRPMVNPSAWTTSAAHRN